MTAIAKKQSFNELFRATFNNCCKEQLDAQSHGVVTPRNAIGMAMYLVNTEGIYKNGVPTNEKGSSRFQPLSPFELLRNRKAYYLSAPHNDLWCSKNNWLTNTIQNNMHTQEMVDMCKKQHNDRHIGALSLQQSRDMMISKSDVANNNFPPMSSDPDFTSGSLKEYPLVSKCLDYAVELTKGLFLPNRFTPSDIIPCPVNAVTRLFLQMDKMTLLVRDVTVPWIKTSNWGEFPKVIIEKYPFLISMVTTYSRVYEESLAPYEKKQPVPIPELKNALKSQFLAKDMTECHQFLTDPLWCITTILDELYKEMNSSGCTNQSQSMEFLKLFKNEYSIYQECGSHHYTDNSNDFEKNMRNDNWAMDLIVKNNCSVSITAPGVLLFDSHFSAVNGVIIKIHLHDLMELNAKNWHMDIPGYKCPHLKNSGFIQCYPDLKDKVCKFRKSQHYIYASPYLIISLHRVRLSNTTTNSSSTSTNNINIVIPNDLIFWSIKDSDTYHYRFSGAICFVKNENNVGIYQNLLIKNGVYIAIDDEKYEVLKREVFNDRLRNHAVLVTYKNLGPKCDVAIVHNDSVVAPSTARTAKSIAWEEVEFPYKELPTSENVATILITANQNRGSIKNYNGKRLNNENLSNAIPKKQKLDLSIKGAVNPGQLIATLRTKPSANLKVGLDPNQPGNSLSQPITLDDDSVAATIIDNDSDLILDGVELVTANGLYTYEMDPEHKDPQQCHYCPNHTNNKIGNSTFICAVCVKNLSHKYTALEKGYKKHRKFLNERGRKSESTSKCCVYCQSPCTKPSINNYHQIGGCTVCLGCIKRKHCCCFLCVTPLGKLIIYNQKAFEDLVKNDVNGKPWIQTFLNRKNLTNDERDLLNLALSNDYPKYTNQIIQKYGQCLSRTDFIKSTAPSHGSLTKSFVEMYISMIWRDISINPCKFEIDFEEDLKFLSMDSALIKSVKRNKHYFLVTTYNVLDRDCFAVYDFNTIDKNEIKYVTVSCFDPYQKARSHIVLKKFENATKNNNDSDINWIIKHDKSRIENCFERHQNIPKDLLPHTGIYVIYYLINKLTNENVELRNDNLNQGYAQVAMGMLLNAPLYA